MTKRFKKARNFDKVSFMREMERSIIEDIEGDVFTLKGIEKGREDDALESEERSSSFEA